ncbi:SIMPL domain-containing protein [Limnohabitans sp. INBF002]|uniref:SIMPL domain-containing protein n=1 Tax=Limnohabitans sp. INBF002 TaxID=2986280 RepID=UPI002377872C|nr:SIMPL domain-containing protein [Limnohabitans sp. INBF002]BDU52461.1 hypothetical protein LINBF2_06960 [Limnohabitans sp. INBF002]
MNEQSEIHIEGRGAVDAKPDGMCLLIKVSSLSHDYPQALSGLNQKVAATNAALREAGVKALAVTKAYVITEQWRNQYDEAKKKFLGHQATQALEVTIPLDRELLGRVIKGLALSDAKPSVSVDFVVRDMNAVMLLARQRAVEHASATALDLAKSAGLQLRGVKSMTYKSQSHLINSSLELNLNSNIDYCLDLTPDVNPDFVRGEENVSIVWFASNSPKNND